ncbi:MAG: hypothetical protein HYY16_19020, partial [Planctomycetes bacterium]|nr:hypothetical protein [Planctomycetota bacterium]
MKKTLPIALLAVMACGLSPVQEQFTDEDLRNPSAREAIHKRGTPIVSDTEALFVLE